MEDVETLPETEELDAPGGREVPEVVAVVGGGGGGAEVGGGEDEVDGPWRGARSCARTRRGRKRKERKDLMVEEEERTGKF